MSSGDTLVPYGAAAAQMLSSNSSTPTPRADTLLYAFDDTTDESIDFVCIMPRSYSGGGVTVSLVWSATTATTGDVVWDFAFKSFSDDADDIDTKSFATAQAVTDTTASASGECVYSEITFTDGAQMDSTAAGEIFHVRVTRDADNVSDTMTGDAQLWGFEIRET